MCGSIRQFSLEEGYGKPEIKGHQLCRAGVVALILRAILKKDLDPYTGPAENFTEVPYGYLTDMEE